MNTIELFAGTGSFSKVAASFDYDIYGTDYEQVDDEFVIHLVKDVRKVSRSSFPLRILPVDILWASPPCEGFSVAAIGHNWTGGKCAYIPNSETAHRSIALVKETLRLIDELKPKWWFIENPRGLLRKLDLIPEDAIRHTVTYCQYGDTRMKPTDIWTNAPWWTPRPMCKNGMPCHVAAPRGSSTGTQGIKGYKDRSRIPPALFEEIFTQLESVDKLKFTP